MRLIDADELNIRDVSPSYWSCVLGVEKDDIDDAPTIDAIPVEYILKQIVKLERSKGQSYHAICYRHLLEVWGMENERKDE